LKVAIAGIGVVGAFGCGVAALRGALVSGGVEPGRLAFRNADGTREMAAYLADTSALTNYVPKRSLRRIDHFSRLALLGSFMALEDAALLEAERSRLAVIIATGYGAARTTFAFLDTVIDDGDALASPTYFAHSVHNVAAAHVAIALGATGPSLTVSQLEASVASALIAARGWLAEGRVDAVLLGGVDECCDVFAYCWESLCGSGEPSGMCPLAFEKQSAIPGEGAAFFVLRRESEAGPVYGLIEDVQQGHLDWERPVFSPDTLLVLGADGHRECGRHYAGCMASGAEAVCFTPLYGSLPVGQAFDMAAAALMIRDDGRFSTPGMRAPRQLNGGHVVCLKVGQGSRFSLVTLKGEGR